uniref:Adhesion G protein-coupled receptor F2 n=3 Tax=Xenopus tropicalis TaxID=8364 RepID=A0A803JWP6_XENTR
MEFLKKVSMFLFIHTMMESGMGVFFAGNLTDITQCPDDFGDCVEGKISCKKCQEGFEGNITTRCQGSEWKPVLENCVSPNLGSLLSGFESIQLSENHFAANVSGTPSIPIDQCPVISFISSGIQTERTTAGNIAAIVSLLQKISLRCFMGDLSEKNVQDYSKMANHILNTSTLSNWTLVPQRNAGSVLLTSLHALASSVASNTQPLPNVTVQEEFLSLQSQHISGDRDFTFYFNSSSQPVSGQILIEKAKARGLTDLSAVSLAYPTLGDILPTESENVSVNGLVMSLAVSANISQIFLKFEKVNKSLSINTHCAAWDKGKETWSQDSCQKQEDSATHALCKCKYSPNYLSFSILMSPKANSDPALHYITLIGLGISICSLVLCLMIEALVWRHVTRHSTAYMRHVSIANIAVSLLLADIWFIIGDATFKAKSSNVCITSTFFTHFFYLSLFFWMLLMGLLILYRLFLVYHDMSRTLMLATLFSVGYGCPFVISILTLAITLNQPGKPYTREDGCWLNWDPSKALLAFIVPAFIILAVNAAVTCTVISVLLRPSIGQTPRTNERGYLVQIGRCVAILTPLLGLTWGIGIATIIEDSSVVFDYLFTILNALQGFLILLLGTLMDPQVRRALKTKMSSLPWHTSETKNTSSNPKCHSQSPHGNKTSDEDLS